MRQNRRLFRMIAIFRDRPIPTRKDFRDKFPPNTENFTVIVCFQIVLTEENFSIKIGLFRLFSATFFFAETLCHWSLSLLN